ncbi:hypothetical protein BJ138DRAFT_1187652, partial [Hygrophoropsis aurantiaca]
IRRVLLYVFDSFQTQLNKFGVGRQYRHRPSYDPDAFVSPDQLSNTRSDSDSRDKNNEPPNVPDEHPPPWPWKNMTIWRLMSWKMTGTNRKSDDEVTRLVKEVINPDGFNTADLSNFNAHTEMKHFDAAEETLEPNDIFRKDGWKEAAVEICVPTREKTSKGNGRPFSIPGFLYRPLTAVIRAAFSEANSKWFHFTPFKRIWKSPVTGREQRVYDELYTSDAWNKAHDDVLKQQRSDNCTLERAIAGLMFWSDSTQLAQFGHANAWPVYMFFGNLSKYMRACPSSGACHPVAFIPSV